MDNASLIIRKKLKEIGLTQECLSEKIGITQGALAHYLNGRRKFNLSVLKDIEEILDMSPGGLTYCEYPDLIPVEPHKHEFKLPVLELSAIYDYVKHDILPENCLYKSIIVVGRELKKGCFIIKIDNNSMVSEKEPRISLYPGEYAIVEKNVPYKNNSLVVANIGDKTNSKIRQYEKEGSDEFLKAFDPHMPHIRIDSNVEILAKICGKYVDYYD